MSFSAAVVADNREEIILDGLDSWQSDFEHDAKSSRQDEDADWWHDGDDDDNAEEAVVRSDRVGLSKADSDYGDDDGDDANCDALRCTLADTTAAHLKYGTHLTNYGYIFGANEWKHEYPMTSFDLGSKSGFTCSEVDTVKLVLEALLGFPNDLFDLAAGDNSKNPALFSSPTKAEAEPYVEQQFVLSFAATNMSVSSGLSSSTLRATLAWFARLASDMHHCRRFACGEMADAGSSAYSRGGSSKPSLLRSLREAVRSAVLEALVHVEAALCELDGSLLLLAAGGQQAAAAPDTGPTQLTLISLYSRVNLFQWPALFKSLRAQVSTVVAAVPSSTIAGLPQHAHAVSDMVANGVLQALFAVQRWRGNTGVCLESLDSIFLPLQTDRSDTADSARAGHGHSTAELASFLQRLHSQHSFLPSRETPAALGSRVDFVVGRLVVASPPPSSSSSSSSVSSTENADAATSGDVDGDGDGDGDAFAVPPSGRTRPRAGRPTSADDEEADGEEEVPVAALAAVSTVRARSGWEEFQPSWTNRDDLLRGLGSGASDGDGDGDGDGDYTDREDDGDDRYTRDLHDLHDRQGRPSHNHSRRPSAGASPHLRLLGEVSQLMPLAARLDLLVSLPVARASRCEDAKAVRFVRDECQFMAHIQCT